MTTRITRRIPRRITTRITRRMSHNFKKAYDEIMAVVVDTNTKGNNCEDNKSNLQLKNNNFISSFDDCYIRKIVTTDKLSNTCEKLSNYVKITYDNGDIEYKLNGKLHREENDEDGYQLPAVITHSGTLEFWKNGLLHNSYGAAIIKKNGYRAYYNNGVLDNKYGPAIFYNNVPSYESEIASHSDGLFIERDYLNYYPEYEHYEDGILHREQDPETCGIGPTKSNRYADYYYWHGKLHREDGPAVIYNNGGYEYHYNGVLHNIYNDRNINTSMVNNTSSINTTSTVNNTATINNTSTVNNTRNIETFPTKVIYYNTKKNFLIFKYLDDSGIETPEIKNKIYDSYVRRVIYYHKQGKLHREDGPAVIIIISENKCLSHSPVNENIFDTRIAYEDETAYHLYFIDNIQIPKNEYMLQFHNAHETINNPESKDNTEITEITQNIQKIKISDKSQPRDKLQLSDIITPLDTVNPLDKIVYETPKNPKRKGKCNDN